MSHLIGFIAALASIRVSFYLLGMDIATYFEDVALIVVFGGTICAAVITYPISDLVKVMQAFLRIARRMPDSKKEHVKQLIEISKANQASPQALIDVIEKGKVNPFLKDGLELIMAGFTKEEINQIMSERIYRDHEREERYGALLRTLSKYPPAFGLVGTVLGLVALMRAVAAGADAGEIGLRMALALVATFYGLLLTNFVLVPMGENLINKSSVNVATRELLLEGILLIKDRKSPVMVQEMLNSYLPPLQRKDLIGLRGNVSQEAS